MNLSGGSELKGFLRLRWRKRCRAIVMMPVVVVGAGVLRLHVVGVIGPGGF